MYVGSSNSDILWLFYVKTDVQDNIGLSCLMSEQPTKCLTLG